MREVRWIVGAAFAAALASFSAASAQAASDYPDTTVELVLPFSAGGGTDVQARILATELEKGWKQSVVILNKPGANGNIGAEVVAAAKPDGYTLLMTTNAMVINPNLPDSHATYDPVKDFDPISLVASVPFAVLVNPNSPVKTFADFIELAKEKPGQLTVGSSGVGGAAHLSIELLKQEAGIDVIHSPYKGGSDEITALLGSHVDVIFVSLLTSTPYIENGSLHAIAVTSAERNPTKPDIPAIAEYPGLEGFDTQLWYGILAPDGTDPAIVEKVHSGFEKALDSDIFRKQIEPRGAVIGSMTTAQFAAKVKADVETWAGVVKSAKLGD